MKIKETNFNILDFNDVNQLYIENIYQKFRENIESVSSYWQQCFQNNKILFDNEKTDIFYTSIHNYKNDFNFYKKQVLDLIRSYGHQYAYLNPLQNYFKVDKLYKLILKNLYYENDINYLHDIKKNKKFFFDNKIYEKFKKIYCTSIGVEYMYINNIKERRWIQEYIETKFINFKYSKTEKINLLNQLIKAECFEKFIHMECPGAKRFSLEGAEVLIPVLNKVIDYASSQLSSKIIIGMAHRGRLNVLVNILGKNIQNLLDEFSDTYTFLKGTGDAKYHAGMHVSLQGKHNKNIEIDLKPNPSHLEIVNTIVAGSAKSNLDELSTKNTNLILPINIHGDAAILGQGINQELLNMSQTNNYQVGGTVHIIINNQIGFTTSKIDELRSSLYCTDLAKMIQSPVLHVNCDHPESVMFITELALQFRYKFKKDVFIDLVCYRRRGHNESDDPYVTQPIMYQKIQNHPTVCTIYSDDLHNKNIIHPDYLNLQMSECYNAIRNCTLSPVKENHNVQKTKKNKMTTSVINIQDIFIKISSIPKHINIHSRVLKIYEERYNMAHGKKLVDWGAAENFAYATILSHGISCRLSGEDVARGTFFHRHAVIHDQKTGLEYIPLNNLKECNSKFYICNSTLSEEATLGFEYGYSIESIKILNIWEAQFGDFCNGAQIIIDQFISSGEQKWGIKSNLIMLLPHGYEGQGPEHSSARIERFLQLCAQNNMKICIPSNSAQMYHILINQVSNDIIRPLIIFTPKSLLRNTMAHSSLNTIITGIFQPIIYEIDHFKEKLIKKIIFCSGKIYYELLSHRRQKKIINVLLIRIEQLYPFPKEVISKLLYSYPNIKNISWCQEEPKNQGAWNYMYHQFKTIISSDMKFNYIGRPNMASTAEGCTFIHKKQQNKIIYSALNVNERDISI